MTDSKNRVLPLHCFVKDVAGEGAGWAWNDGRWRLCQIAWSDDDDDHVLIMMVGEHTEIYAIDDVGDLPWIPVSLPPYNGDEKPCTHAVTIVDSRASCTFSWSMNESDGKSAVQKITGYIDAMLRDTDAQTSVGVNS